MLRRQRCMHQRGDTWRAASLFGEMAVAARTAGIVRHMFFCRRFLPLVLPLCTYAVPLCYYPSRDGRAGEIEVQAKNSFVWGVLSVASCCRPLDHDVFTRRWSCSISTMVNIGFTGKKGCQSFTATTGQTQIFVTFFFSNRNACLCSPRAQTSPLRHYLF